MLQISSRLFDSQVAKFAWKIVDNLSCLLNHIHLSSRPSCPVCLPWLSWQLSCVTERTDYSRRSRLSNRPVWISHRPTRRRFQSNPGKVSRTLKISFYLKKIFSQMSCYYCCCLPNCWMTTKPSDPFARVRRPVKCARKVKKFIRMESLFNSKVKDERVDNKSAISRRVGNKMLIFRSWPLIIYHRVQLFSNFIDGLVPFG